MTTETPGARYFPTLGWKAVLPQTLGVDPDKLAAMHTAIASQHPTVDSVLVVRQGQIVYERYYHNLGRSTLFEQRSGTKSVTALLIGIALGRKLFTSVDQKLVDILPDYYTGNADARAKHITLHHLLSMTAGFAWDPRGQAEALDRRTNVKAVLNGPIAHTPGDAFCYDPVNAHLLLHALLRVSGRHAAMFAEEHLFKPLGIGSYQWPQDRQGINLGSTGLSLTARSMAKIAYLLLSGGNWDGQQLLPPEYVQAVTTAHSAGGYPGGTPYGYLWWASKERGWDAGYSLGFGGKIAMAVPALDLVAVVMADDSLGLDHLNGTKTLITDFIIPSCSVK